MKRKPTMIVGRHRLDSSRHPGKMNIAFRAGTGGLHAAEN
jgi:hypothetical protein